MPYIKHFDFAADRLKAEADLLHLIRERGATHPACFRHLIVREPRDADAHIGKQHGVDEGWFTGGECYAGFADLQYVVFFNVLDRGGYSSEAYMVRTGGQWEAEIGGQGEAITLPIVELFDELLSWIGVD